MGSGLVLGFWFRVRKRWGVVLVLCFGAVACCVVLCCVVGSVRGKLVGLG